MNFNEIKYTRPDLDALKKEYQEVTEKLMNAKSFEEAEAAFLEEDKIERKVMTQGQIAMIRRDCDTRDAFYVEEAEFCESSMPILQECTINFSMAMMNSPFKAQFEEKYGKLLFLNNELSMKAFKPELIPVMQKENALASEYENLLASAKIEFEGNTYTLSQMTPFMNDADDERRLAAWKAEGGWYKSVQPEMDRIYDELVKLRDQIGKDLGYEGFTPVGYFRMHRNCYTKEDIEKFHTAVQKYVVPVAEEIYKKQAERLGKTYPLSFADAQMEFRSGNPTPQGTPDELVEAAGKFYDWLSPETSKFFRTMREGNLMNLLSTEGKRGGGYCTGLPDYEVPFIFANFNGTQGDVTVLTHEAGHAFEAWMNVNRTPLEYMWPSSEACEVHSMGMEFFGEAYAEEFFGKDARKFLYSHLSGALTFIPYGTLVDHFQHVVYEKPEMTPAERHAVWKELMGVYMPWMKLDGDIPFYADGEHWQLKHHIYSNPFYYIDYCLAQTVALELWAMIQEDRENAWKHYMAYTEQGGSEVFTDLLKNAGLSNPFEEETLKGICSKAAAYLEAFDLTGIE